MAGPNDNPSLPAAIEAAEHLTVGELAHLSMRGPSNRHRDTARAASEEVACSCMLVCFLRLKISNAG